MHDEKQRKSFAVLSDSEGFRTRSGFKMIFQAGRLTHPKQEEKRKEMKAGYCGGRALKEGIDSDWRDGTHRPLPVGWLYSAMLITLKTLTKGGGQEPC